MPPLRFGQSPDSFSPQSSVGQSSGPRRPRAPARLRQPAPPSPTTQAPGPVTQSPGASGPQGTCKSAAPHAPGVARQPHGPDGRTLADRPGPDSTPPRRPRPRRAHPGASRPVASAVFPSAGSSHRGAAPISRHRRRGAACLPVRARCSSVDGGFFNGLPPRHGGDLMVRARRRHDGDGLPPERQQGLAGAPPRSARGDGELRSAAGGCIRGARCSTAPRSIASPGPPRRTRRCSTWPSPRRAPRRCSSRWRAHPRSARRPSRSSPTASPARRPTSDAIPRPRPRTTSPSPRTSTASSSPTRARPTPSVTPSSRDTRARRSSSWPPRPTRAPPSAAAQLAVDWPAASPAHDRLWLALVDPAAVPAPHARGVVPGREPPPGARPPRASLREPGRSTRRARRGDPARQVQPRGRLQPLRRRGARPPRAPPIPRPTWRRPRRRPRSPRTATGAGRRLGDRERALRAAALRVHVASGGVLAPDVQRALSGASGELTDDEGAFLAGHRCSLAASSAALVDRIVRGSRPSPRRGAGASPPGLALRPVLPWGAAGEGAAEAAGRRSWPDERAEHTEISLRRGEVAEPHHHRREPPHRQGPPRRLGRRGPGPLRARRPRPRRRRPRPPPHRRRADDPGPRRLPSPAPR